MASAVAAVRERVLELAARGAREKVLAHPGEAGLSSTSSAGRKCAWRFGVAPCVLLFLPGGQIVAEASAAIVLAEQLILERAGQHRALVATNPAAVDRSNVLLRVTADVEVARKLGINVSTDDDLTVWVQNGRARAAFKGEDAKAMLWPSSSGAGGMSSPVRLLALFSVRLPPSKRRVMIHDVYGRKFVASGRQMMMAARSLHNIRSQGRPQGDVRLSGMLQLGAPRRPILQQFWEKNWSPLPFAPSIDRSYSGGSTGVYSGGELLLSYRLTPEHVVIRCDVQQALELAPNSADAPGHEPRPISCTHAYNSSSHAAWAAHRAEWVLRESPAPRLTSSTVNVNGAFLSIGHYRTSHVVYLHFLYELEPHPPFAVRRVSRPFRFRSLPSSMPPIRRGARAQFGPAGAPSSTRSDTRSDRAQGPHGVQFASGLYHARRAGRLVITYGVGTRASLNTSISVSAAFRMLSDGAQAAAESWQHEQTATQHAREAGHHGVAGDAPSKSKRGRDFSHERFRYCGLEAESWKRNVAGASCDDTRCAPKFDSSAMYEQSEAKQHTLDVDQAKDVLDEVEPTLALCPLVCERYPYDCSATRSR